jgi:hypothetical protein
MSFRSTLALLVVAAGLGAYVYFVEIVGKREQAEQEVAEKKILRIESDAVSRIDVPLDPEGRAVLVRAEAEEEGGEGWRLESPLAFPADPLTVSELLRSLGALESQSALDERPEDLAPFGLAEAPPELKVWTGEAEPHVLYLGGKAPLGNQRYVALDGDDRLFVVEASAVDALRPDLKSLRDKRITRVRPEDVQRISVSEHGTLLVEASRAEAAAAGEEGAAEPEARWDLEKPVAQPADAERIRRVIQNLAFARASDFVDEPADLAPYGLDAPELEVVLEQDDARDVIQIGSADSKAYVRVNHAPLVFEVQERLLADVPRSLFDYRFKQVLSFSEVDANRLEVHFPRDDVGYRFTRRDLEWTPEDPDIEVRSIKIEDIVYAIHDLEATSIDEQSSDPAALGLDPPSVRVTARNDAGEDLGWLELGEPTSDRGLPVRASGSDHVWRVSNDLLLNVPLSLEGFRNQWLEQPAAEPAGTPTPTGEGTGAADESEVAAEP